VYELPAAPTHFNSELDPVLVDRLIEGNLCGNVLVNGFRNSHWVLEGRFVVIVEVTRKGEKFN